MTRLAVSALCALCLIQNVCSQYIGAGMGPYSQGLVNPAMGYPNPAALAAAGVGLAPIASGMEGAYGGSGIGDVAVAGEMPVAGTTLIAGQVPILGAVRFAGDLPAGGVVTISGSCGCGAPGPILY